MDDNAEQRLEMPTVQLRPAPQLPSFTRLHVNTPNNVIERAASTFLSQRNRQT